MIENANFDDKVVPNFNKAGFPLFKDTYKYKVVK